MYSADNRDSIKRYKVPVFSCEVVITISIFGIFQAKLVPIKCELPMSADGLKVAIHRKFGRAARFNCTSEMAGFLQNVARSILCNNHSGSSSRYNTTEGLTYITASEMTSSTALVCL